MIKAFIVDDEPLARDELKYLLRRTKRVEIVGEAESCEEALEGIEETAPDVVFLDIQLSDATGIDIAERLVEGSCQPVVVFATAYDEYALKAFELNAADYILKPYEEVRIQQTVDKLIQRLSVTPAAAGGGNNTISPIVKPAERTERLALTVEERIAVVHIDRILYIGFEEGKTVVVTDGQRYKVSEALTVLERKINHPSILRVHRAYLVNVDYVMEIEPYFYSTYVMKMKDGASIPVSRTYVKDLKQKLGL